MLLTILIVTLRKKSDAFNSKKYLDNDDELEESDDGVSKDIEGEGRVSSHPPLTHTHDS